MEDVPNDDLLEMYQNLSSVMKIDPAYEKIIEGIRQHIVPDAYPRR